MRKEWILTDEEKSIKRQKIVRNRLIKQRTQLDLRQSTNKLSSSNLKHDMKSSEVSFQEIRFDFLNPDTIEYIFLGTNQTCFKMVTIRRAIVRNALERK